MSIREALQKYVNKEMTAIEFLRLLSGAFNPDMAADLLALVNQVCRHEEGDLDTETFKSLYDLV